MGSCTSKPNSTPTPSSIYLNCKLAIHSIRHIPSHLKTQSAGIIRGSDLFSDGSPVHNLDMAPRSGVLPPSKKFDLNYTTIPNKLHKRLTVWDNQVFGLVGLMNLGNTCFMNSALQCLLNVPPLTDYFLSDLHSKEINRENFLGSKGEVTNAYANLVRDFWENNNQAALSPDNFYSSFSRFAPQFSNGTQEDSHDFLAILLDVIHEDLNRVKERPVIEYTDPKGKNLQEQAANAWKNHLLRNKSIIVDLFQGQIKSSLTCHDCKYVSYKYEPFMYLSLPIPEETKKEITLNQCLDEFIKEEKLDKEERWHCSQCKAPKDSSKKIDIWTLPNILIVHLKRFQFTRQKRGKIKTIINFPVKDLNLSNYLSNTQKDKPIYDLFAISCHEGNLGGGHYTSYVKNRDTHSWFFFNDSSVKEIDISKTKMVQSSGYVLFYSKTSVDSFARQTVSDPAAWPHFSAGRKFSESLMLLNDPDAAYEISEGHISSKKKLPKINKDINSKSNVFTTDKKGLSLTPVKNDVTNKSVNHLQLPNMKVGNESRIERTTTLTETNPKRRLIKNRNKPEVEEINLLQPNDVPKSEEPEDRPFILPSLDEKKQDSRYKSPIKVRLDTKKTETSYAGSSQGKSRDNPIFDKPPSLAQINFSQDMSERNTFNKVHAINPKFKPHTPSREKQPWEMKM